MDAPEKIYTDNSVKPEIFQAWKGDEDASDIEYIRSDIAENLAKEFAEWLIMQECGERIGKERQDALFSEFTEYKKTMKKIIGYNFLHTHPVSERFLKIPTEHVIIDKCDYDKVCKFFINNPELFEQLIAQETNNLI